MYSTAAKTPRPLDTWSEQFRSAPKASTWNRAWLRAQVHLDAFRLNPAAYLGAIFWRIRGFRLRSRNRLAPLLGQSSHAYKLWISAIETAAHEKLLEEFLDERIVPVATVDERSDPRILQSRIKAQGTWVCILGAGDQLSADAIDIYARAAARFPDAWAIYADDDLIENGARSSPHFKPDWNPELFEGHDFVSGAAIIRVTPDMAGGLTEENWAAQLLASALERGKPIHLPAVLHHRRSRPAPEVPQKPDELPSRLPLVSVIIPTRNNFGLLRTCYEGVQGTIYPNIEIIVVDNGSDDPQTLDYLERLAAEGVIVLRIPGPFNFSALNNSAARAANGELLCFLNNDVEIVDPDWLSLLVRHAVLADLGAVGARLLYPDGTVQHAGVVTGVGGGAAHAHRFQRDTDAGYFMRDRLPQRVSAVTAACMVVEKAKFLAVGGFNEEDFPVAFNDIDLSLKLNERGWQSFYEPRAVLIHHESKSRGRDSAKENRDRFAKELAALKRHWRTDLKRDPYHHPQLSPFSEQFVIAL